MATILLVDDHPTNRQLLKAMLGKTGHQFLEAADGLEALAALESEHVDLMLCDILMPRMDGFQLVFTLRSRPELPQPPVIFITADYLEKEARTLADACGVALFMTKPINLPVLLATIDSLVGKPESRPDCPPEQVLLQDYARLLANKLHRQLGALNQLNSQLELRVEERTRQLNQAVQALEREVRRRQEAEEALRLANMRLTEEALHDSLTCLYNRRYLELSLERTLRRCEHDRKTLGVMMIDFDHFKHCNDSYGHAAGDAVLVEVSRYLQSLVRNEDMLCRYGGEELLLVMQASREVLWERAEVLRRGVEALRIEWEGHLLPKVTVSVGMALFPAHGSNGQDLIQAADMALYQAKLQGRNCSVLYVPGETPSPCPSEVR